MTPSLAHQSVTRLIRNLQGGRESSTGPLLKVYFQRLVQLARKRLQNVPGLDSYEEDVALRSFHSMCRRVQDAQRPLELADRNDLWRLLATRTVSRAIDLIRRQRLEQPADERAVEQLLSREPTAEEAAEIADECRRLLDLLDEPQLRQIALWKVEGFSHEEIAARLDCVPRTVERKVQRIRILWKDELAELQT
jgi:DNA-directed RNA polymerase specialized sigma24 family protein